MMSSDTEFKQNYLRKEILEKNYNPSEFIEYLNSKLNIGDNLDLCTIDELKEVVQGYIQLKRSPEVSMPEEPPAVQQLDNKQIVSQKTLPPKQILFEKYGFIQPQFSKSYQCIKTNNRFGDPGKIKCAVFDPQRKTTAGFFGFGGSTFLQFQVRTHGPDWLVGRRYSDFVWLRSYLLKVYPTQIIPPIPNKKASKRTQRHVEKRMRILEYFLNDIVNIPELLNNRYVEGFLRLTDPAKLQQYKEDCEKVKPFENVSSVETDDGKVTVKLTEENRLYLSEMMKLIPEVERIYKQVTRQGKALQELCTQEVNGLYEIGNLFAELHERSREILNKLPRATGLAKLNEIYISLNNMMIEWGNIVRNQHQFMEKNFSTFFKYVRNELHGYNELFTTQTNMEDQFAKALLTLERKKEKTYNLFDVSKWDLTKEAEAAVTKETLHSKNQAVKMMFPKDTQQLERLRVKDYVYISQFHINGNCNMERAATKFLDNFKEFAIKNKVNTQQLSELWSEMGASFSGTNTVIKQLKEVPVDIWKGDEIVDD